MVMMVHDNASFGLKIELIDWLIVPDGITVWELRYSALDTVRLRKRVHQGVGLDTH